MSMLATTPRNAIACSERPIREALPTHLPVGLALDVGAAYEHAHGIGVAALRLCEAQLAGSATAMQMASQEIAEIAQRIQMTATRIERQLARHRRRNSEAGVRS
jgi:hypothetical protein